MEYINPSIASREKIKTFASFKQKNINKTMTKKRKPPFKRKFNLSLIKDKNIRRNLIQMEKRLRIFFFELDEEKEKAAFIDLDTRKKWRLPNDLLELVCAYMDGIKLFTIKSDDETQQFVPYNYKA